MHQLFLIWMSLILPATADRFTGDNNNSQIRFDVASTLHIVPGKITRFTAELNVEKDVTGTVVIQSEGIKTGINVRDQRMYSYCLDAEQFPTIRFDIRGVTDDVEGFTSAQGTGTIKLHGKLSIRSTGRDIIVPATYSWTEAGLVIKGSTKVNWSDYGVPDPSILISKVQPVLDVHFDLKMSKTF
jgi:polyisoprenoid-binding protein YceI